MIISRLMGGHSNQLFQYALGRSLASKHRTDLLLDITWFDEAKDIDAPRDYELDVYPLVAQTTTLRGITVIDPRKPAGKKTRLHSLIRPGKTVHKYYEPGLGYDPNALSLPNNSYLEGFWQNSRYFSDIRDDLLKELEPIDPPNKKNQKLIDQMKKTESIWMHIRRGDYVQNKATLAFHGSKDLEYYRKALETLVKKLPADKRKNIEIFVCSNDIPWCKKNLDFPYPVNFVENKLGSDDMRVIKHCKHDILANSSFSWWGAWLNEYPDKIVIAPKQWFNDKKANAEIDIVPPEWIRL